jgi:hypothetical protein
LLAGPPAPTLAPRSSLSEEIGVSYQVGRYDPAERQREKQASREQDDARLRSGQVSRAELRLENNPFSGLDVSSGPIVDRWSRQAAHAD